MYLGFRNLVKGDCECFFLMLFVILYMMILENEFGFG